MTEVKSNLETATPVSMRSRLGQCVAFGIVCVITLVALFYAVENWRGHRAWIRYKAELVGRGEEMDWAVFAPPKVPDDQNFMKVPLMDAWFQKSPSNESAPTPSGKIPNPSQHLGGAELDRLHQLASGEALREFSHSRHAPDPLLEIDLTPSDGLSAEENNTLASFVRDDQIERAVRETGAVILTDPRGSLILAAGPKPPLKRIRLQLTKDKERARLNKALKKAGFELRPTGTVERFQLVNASAIPSRDALDYFAQFDSEFNELYKACERPSTHFGGDSTDPFSVPMPDFVNVRTVAQILGTKATAELFTGQPDQAFREVHTLLRLMDALSGAHPTLVTMMIRVAIGGLTVDLIKTGMERDLWREEQYIAIQRDLSRFDFLSDVVRALRGGERAGMNFILENFSRAKLEEMLDPRLNRKRNGFSPLLLYIRYAPQGWFYRNQVALSQAHQIVLDTIDLSKSRIDTDGMDQAMGRVISGIEHQTVHNFLCAMLIPNEAKALQTATRNQTFVNEARIGCALERYHAAKGEYPDSLAALSPTFIEKLPCELTTGCELQYRRDGKKGYALYSVGWNREDDGGLPGSDRDWVWSSGTTQTHL